jgi:hypothetical protein
MHSFSNGAQLYSFKQADSENLFEQIFDNHNEGIFNFAFDINEDIEEFNQMKGEFSQNDFRVRGRRINETFSNSIKIKQEALVIEVFFILENFSNEIRRS